MAKQQTDGPSNIFQLVSDPSEKMRILYDLVRSGQSLSAKLHDRLDETTQLTPRLVQGSELLCRPEKTGFFKSASGELVTQFQVGGQKYICSVPFRQIDEFLALGMERKLFRVQRREFFRLQLPTGFRGTLFVPELHGVAFNQSFHLVDLSGGGCKIQMPKLELNLKTGDVFKAIMRIPGRQEFPVLCTVRYQSKLPARQDSRWFGLEFQHPTEPERNRMAAVVMDLYRELFSRL